MSISTIAEAVASRLARLWPALGRKSRQTNVTITTSGDSVMLSGCPVEVQEDGTVKFEWSGGAGAFEQIVIMPAGNVLGAALKPIRAITLTPRRRTRTAAIRPTTRGTYDLLVAGIKDRKFTPADCPGPQAPQPDIDETGTMQVRAYFSSTTGSRPTMIVEAA